MEQPTQENPKLKQFREELKELENKYQYELEAKINYTAKGIFPTIAVYEKLPPKSNVNPPEQPKETEDKKPADKKQEE